ncbi:MAG: hypothetical protein OEY94_07860 [Alphaproteobacteria bacterium]|nr:hypothetical protein [Alphaproteobacteria bacterium]
MLPETIKYRLFDYMSVQTMRYVENVPIKKATGLVKDVYDQVQKDFFINGTITSQSKVPELMAGMWSAGREILLVTDKEERTVKEAIGGTLSYLNDCPYCADMFVSLVHGGGEKDAASNIMFENEDAIKDESLRKKLLWVRDATLVNKEGVFRLPFTQEQIPEVLGALLMSSYVNRYSHVVMDGSPVIPPFGLQKIKDFMLKMFGRELHVTTRQILEPGTSLNLLPKASLPDDLYWSAPNQRIADAISRWAAAIDREVVKTVSPEIRELVESSLQKWDCKRMPLSRRWVEEEIEGLEGKDRAHARLALVMAKGSYHFDETLMDDVLSYGAQEEDIIRILAWASFTGARRLTELTADTLGLNNEVLVAV